MGVCRGKVEPGETKEWSFIWECQEELAIALDVIREHPDLTVHLTRFRSTIQEDISQKLEHMTSIGLQRVRLIRMRFVLRIKRY